jgi:hypothetical protein
MKTSQLHLKGLVLSLSLLVAGSAQAVPLTDLLAGGSITVGDKLFDDWQEIFQSSSLDFFTHTVNTDNIDVTAVDDGGDFGLQFDILNNEFAVTGDDIYAFIDYTFGFRVSVLDPDYKIEDAWLREDGSLSVSLDGFNDLGFFTQESVGTAPGLDDLGTMYAEFSVLDDALTSDIEDQVVFDPQSEIWVTKNLFIWSQDSTDTADFDSLTQRVSQVPEPTTLLLMTVGLIGTGLARRTMRAPS